LAPVFTLELSAQNQNSISASQPRPSISVLDSTRERDGLLGSVRRVKIESAKVEMLDGRAIEGPHQLLEVTTYGFDGNRLENISYPSPESFIGKEEYKYNDRGNIIEMTLRNDRGDIVNRESYSYEFDRFGNWTKMLTSLVVFENGQLKREPVEVTYRTVTYYYNDSIANIVNESAPRRMPSAPESTELQPPSLEDKQIAFNPSSSANVSAAALEPAGAPPTMATKPPEIAKRQTANNEANVASQAARTEAVADRVINKSSAANTARANPSVREGNEGKRKENVSVPVTAGNSSPAASSGPEGSPVNYKPPKNAAFDYYQLGLARFDASDVKGAVEAYLDSIKLESNSAEVFLNLGVAYLKLEKDKEAASAFKESVKLNPDEAEAQYGFGLALYRLHRFREAVVAFKRATNLSPKMAKAHLGLGLAYQELSETNFVLQEQRILERLDKDLAKRLTETHPPIPCKLKPLCQ
jgi:tetratricopeptide (TPR) repeat protein